MSAPPETLPKKSRNWNEDDLLQCMHCGLCLPTCPTYALTGLERQSPRGRISLMRAVDRGELEAGEDFAEEMGNCLGCLACESACPAGVRYGSLLESARNLSEQHSNNAVRGFWRWLTLDVIFLRPRFLGLLALGLRFWQKSGLQTFTRRSGLVKLLRFIPGDVAEMEPLAPTLSSVRTHDLIQERELPFSGKARWKVLMLTGCVQDFVLPEVNRDTVEVLKENDCEVWTPKHQSCCGSLHAHNGALDLSRELAMKWLDQIPLGEVDAIITNAGGCGSHLKHFASLFDSRSAYYPKAKAWDQKVKDIHEWLAQVGWKHPQAKLETPCRVGYHDSCHLVHGQKISGAPRQILRSIPGVNLVEIKEANWCCGSAGIYNITRPDNAKALLDRKVENIENAEVDLLALSNPGCHLHVKLGLEQAAARTGTQPLEIKWPVTLLAEAYRRDREAEA